MDPTEDFSAGRRSQDTVLDDAGVGIRNCDERKRKHAMIENIDMIRTHSEDFVAGGRSLDTVLADAEEVPTEQKDAIIEQPGEEKPPGKRRRKILGLICLVMVLQMICMQVIQSQQAALAIINNFIVIVRSLIANGNILHEVFADDSLVEEAERCLVEQQNQSSGDLGQAGVMKLVQYVKDEVSRADMDVEDLTCNKGLPDESDNVDVHLGDEGSGSAVKAGVNMHVELAKNLFNRHLRQEVELPDRFFEDFMDSSSEPGE